MWWIEEFAYLQPTRWNDARSTKRMPHLVRYWTEADPNHCDGDGAKSFAALPRRAEATFARLAALPNDKPVYVFGHRQFNQAVRSIVVDINLDVRGKMHRFWRAGAPPAIGNAAGRLRFGR